MSSRNARALRLRALAAVAVVVVGLIGTPVVTAADPTPSQAAGHQAISRGRVVPALAAEAAKDVMRPVARQRALPAPRFADRAQSTTIPRATSSVRIPAPAPKSVAAFTGITEAADAPGIEPPDPWLAASTSHLVQSTNNMVRISDRNGTTLVSVPTWAMFALWPSESDADPRILWDGAHGRWVGVLLSYTEDGGGSLTSGYLNVAISDSADPTGSWRIFAFPYRTSDGLQPVLPDYPGIASSTDKLVLTANEFTLSGGLETVVGSSFLVIRWSDILSGAAPTVAAYRLYPTLWSIRPAIVESASADVHLIAEDTAMRLRYGKLTGATPASPAWSVVAAGAFCTVSPPEQPGSPATIVDAADGRPTDAIWRAGRLTLVSTCDYLDAGDLYVRVTRLDTTVSPPAVLTDNLLGAGAGTDAYMGGIGYSGDGSLFVTYTQSSPSLYPSTYAAVYRAGAWSSSILVSAGTAAYTGSRWGDYVGVAPDPAGTAAVWQANQTADADGTWKTKVSRLVLDLAAPAVTGPTQALVSGTTIDAYSIPVRITWTATDAGSGVTASRLSVNQFNAGMRTLGLTTVKAVTRNHYWKYTGSVEDYSYRYAAAAVDAYGTWSGALPGPSLSAVVSPEVSAPVKYAGTWSASSSSSYLGGRAKYSSAVGAAATFTYSGRSFGFVTYASPTRGKAKIYVDGVYKATLTLTSSTIKARNIAYATTFAAAGTHAIKVVVLSGRVDVDAFVVLK